MKIESKLLTGVWKAGRGSTAMTACPCPDASTGPAGTTQTRASAWKDGKASSAISLSASKLDRSNKMLANRYLL